MYCVGREYFLQLSTVYTIEGGDKAGMIFSQLNFNQAQRAMLTSGGFGIAAVVTGMDNHTSVSTDGLRIEAQGSARSNGGWGPLM